MILACSLGYLAFLIARFDHRFKPSWVVLNCPKCLGFWLGLIQLDLSLACLASATALMINLIYEKWA
jgi:hypothetical protein